MGSSHGFGVQKAIIRFEGYITCDFHSMRKSAKDAFLRMYTSFQTLHDYILDTVI